MSRTLTVATRQSPLALYQTRWVVSRLEAAYPDWDIKLMPMTTAGDRWQHTPLNQIGGKALFVNALEEKLLNQEADIAIHSMKDVPCQLPAGLTLAAIAERETPRDVYIPSNEKMHWADLPEGACVGSCSLRRAIQLKVLRPDLVIKPLRGNVPTRLQKCHSGQYDGIVLAEAGVKRLDLLSHVQYTFSTDELLPAAGQGAIGIECRAGEADLIESLSVLSDVPTTQCIMAEREVALLLEGSCHVPIGAYAWHDGQMFHFKVRVGTTAGDTYIAAEAQAPRDQAQVAVAAVKQNLLAQGAKDIIDAIHTRGFERPPIES